MIAGNLCIQWSETVGHNGKMYAVSIAFIANLIINQNPQQSSSYMDIGHSDIGHCQLQYSDMTRCNLTVAITLALILNLVNLQYLSVQYALFLTM